jgi:predicted enzyme involved in methoxymalonyl-ACP biosynthesis
LLVSKNGSVKDLCISCRALGRGLENAIIGKSLEVFGRENKCEDISFHPKIGPKNEPARRWLNELFVGQEIDRELSVFIGFQKLLKIDIPKGLQFIYLVDER